jgi:hypothetical protein
MKCYFYLLMGFGIAGINSCKTASKADNTSLLVGKLVISEICSHLVVSVESGNISPDKLTASFRDEKRATSFNNVFTIANTCNFEKTGIKEGDRFYFEIIPNTAQEECMVCMAYYPTPEAKLSITRIKKINR